MLLLRILSLLRHSFSWGCHDLRRVARKNFIPVVAFCVCGSGTIWNVYPKNFVRDDNFFRLLRCSGSGTLQMYHHCPLSTCCWGIVGIRRHTESYIPVNSLQMAQDLRQNAEPDIVIILVGNKMDLVEQDPARREVHYRSSRCICAEARYHRVDKGRKPVIEKMVGKERSCSAR